MRPVTINPNNPQSALQEIQRASHEADLTEIAQNFSIGNAPSAQRALNGANVQISAAGIGNGADATEDTLFSYTLPGGSLALTGEGVTIQAAGALANNAHNKTVRLYFGTQAYSLGTVSTANVTWWARATVIKTGAGAQLILFEACIGSTVIAPSILTSSQTDTSTITIKVTGQSGSSAAADVVANMLVTNPLVSDIADAFATWIADCQKGGANRTT